MKTITKYNPHLNCWYEFNPVRAECVLITERLRSLVETSDRELLDDDCHPEAYEGLYEYLVEQMEEILYPNMNIV
jgi:hypothetical protein